MSENKCNLCENDLVFDGETVCAQCELIKEADKKVETCNALECGTCKNSVDENTEGLYCDVCDKWYHNACCESPLIEYLHHLLKEAPNNVKWFCDKCIWEREKWISSLKGGNEIKDNEVSDDLSDIEIENNLNVRKRNRPRRLNDDVKYNYDETNEPEVLIDERSHSADSIEYEERKKAEKKKKIGPKNRKKRRKLKNACDMCSACFLTPENLEAHKLLHQGDDKPFKCTECDKAFSLKGSLVRHAITHEVGKSFFCDICEKGFKWKSAYMRHHKEIHSDDKQLQCTLCDFTSTNQSRIDAHMLKHSEHRPYKCDKCDYGGKTIWTLKAHMITHSSEKPYECKECGKAFNKPDRLKNHMYEHTGAWPFSCDVCGFKCASESALIIHARMHTDERPYPCTICDHRARTKNALNQHMVTHSGVKAFPCDICGKKLCHASALKTHMMIHSGEKPHKCELCHKKFRLSGTLKKHMEYHAKTNFQVLDKPYKCECGNSYKSMNSLNKHKRGARGRKPCPVGGGQGTGNYPKDPISTKSVNNDQKSDAPSFTDQESLAIRYIVKPLSTEKAPLKVNLKASIEQAQMIPKENLTQQNNPEPSSAMHSLSMPPQNCQNNPPPLLYAGITNNYQQYHEMFMNASNTQWVQNKFWN